MFVNNFLVKIAVLYFGVCLLYIVARISNLNYDNWFLPFSLWIIILILCSLISFISLKNNKKAASIAPLTVFAVATTTIFPFGQPFGFAIVLFTVVLTLMINVIETVSK
jgi:hypothetical protein